jgi:hypothetical protein
VFRVYDSNLTSFTPFTPAGTQRIGGMSVYKNGSTYYLYVAREAASSAVIERYNVTNTGSISLDTSFGVLGQYNVVTNLPTALNLTGLEVDSDGTIYATDRDIDKVFKISADLSTFSSVTLSKAMDVAMFGDKLYVSQYNGSSSSIGVLNKSDLSFVETLNTGIARDNVTDSGYAGIDISASGKIYLVDQLYSNTPSTLFKDRILVSSAVPEPTCASLLGLASLAVLRRRRTA